MMSILLMELLQFYEESSKKHCVNIFLSEKMVRKVQYSWVNPWKKIHNSDNFHNVEEFCIKPSEIILLMLDVIDVLSFVSFFEGDLFDDNKISQWCVLLHNQSTSSYVQIPKNTRLSKLLKIPHLQLKMCFMEKQHLDRTSDEEFICYGWTMYTHS